jgi:uncharacterized protein
MTANEMLWPLVGGALIGLAASALLLFNGRILGVTGIFAGIIKPTVGDVAWRVAFVVGLIFGGLVLIKSGFPAFPAAIDRSPLWLVASGILVGFGTRLGNGCTSGHGVCGNSRLSLRSIIATITFMASGAATVFVIRHVLGGAS